MKLIFTGEVTSFHYMIVDQRSGGRHPRDCAVRGRGHLADLGFICFGYFSAVRAGGFTDKALTVLALVGISMPVFWLANR